MRARLAVALTLLIAVAAGAAVAMSALGPGDPTTLFADGFTTPCRTSFGPDGYLYVADMADHFIYRVAPDGSATLFSDDVADTRSIAFDAFGILLVADRAGGTVWRVDGNGNATPFLTGMVTPIRPRVGPNGDIWVAAVDTLYRFDAMGRPLGGWDLLSQGQGVYGLQFDPAGTLYVTSYGGFSTFEEGILTPLPVTAGRNGAPHFDVAGAAYWIHESVEPTDTHRMVLAASDLTVTDEAFASFSDGPCAHVFGRDADGTPNTRQFVSLRNGTIVEVNSAGVASPGMPETGLELVRIDAEECAGEILGQESQVTDDELYFLDVIGNDDGSYDVGDFRAYLVATGAIG